MEKTTKQKTDSLLWRVERQPAQLLNRVGELVTEEVLADPTKKIADLGMGGGDYLKYVLDLRLKAGVPRDLAVKTLYGFESSPRYLSFAVKKRDLQGANLAILKACDIEKLRMEFDAIIGNPPYQDSSTDSHDKKLWRKISLAALDLLKPGGKLVLVTPSSLVGRTQEPAKFRSILSGDVSLEFLDHTANNYFDVGVDICQWLAVKKPYSGKTLVVDNSGERSIDLRKDLPLKSDKIRLDALAEKIHDAVFEGKVPLLNSVTAPLGVKEEEGGIYKTYKSGRNKYYFSNEATEGLGKWKLAVSYSATYKLWFITKDNVCGSHQVLEVSTPEEGLEVGETLLTPLNQFYFDTWRKTAGYTPAVQRRRIPDLRGMSNEEIYQAFDLTPEEIKIIEGHYSPYKEVQRVL
jgi:hypothetical protein